MWVGNRRDDGPPDSFVTLSAFHLSRYRESLPHKACRHAACGGRLVWVVRVAATTTDRRVLLLMTAESASDCHTVLTAEKGRRDGQQVGESRWARTSPTDGGECVGLLHSPEGGECVGLPQQVRAARRRVLYVRNCATVEHVVARRRAIRRQDVEWVPVEAYSAHSPMFTAWSPIRSRYLATIR